MEHFDPRSGVTNIQDDDCRRSAGRLGQEALQCQLGAITNLSAGGMRVICRRVPAGEIDLTLWNPGEHLQVRARVAWSKRVGLFKHEVGLQFIEVSPENAKALTALATAARQRRSC